jgi:glycerophosphoryl diester phosphodiesterase
MIQVIAHRGLLAGPDQKLENNLDQILDVLENTPFGVEFDIRFTKNYVVDIGHDYLNPQSTHLPKDLQLQKILSNQKSLIHCKDSGTFCYMKQHYPATEIFDHDKEA